MLISGIIYGRLVLDVYLTPLPQTNYSCIEGHSRRNFICLYWSGFLGLHYPWVKVGLKGLAISDLKGSVVTIEVPEILLPSSTILKFYCLSNLDYKAYHRLLFSILGAHQISLKQYLQGAKKKMVPLPDNFTPF